MTSKRPTILAAAAAAALMLSACSGSGGQNPAPSTGDSTAPATVTWSTWGSPSELKRYEEFNTKFMAKHPNITVKLQSVPSYSDYHARLLAQLTSRTAPDVFYVGDDKIGQFVDSGALMDVTDVLKAPNAVAPFDAFNPATFGAATSNDAVFAARTTSTPTPCGTTRRP